MHFSTFVPSQFTFEPAGTIKKPLRAPSFQGESEDKDDRRDDPRFILDNELEEFGEEVTAFGHAEVIPVWE
jgi:hypothetical protein